MKRMLISFCCTISVRHLVKIDLKGGMKAEVFVEHLFRELHAIYGEKLASSLVKGRIPNSVKIRGSHFQLL